MSEQIVTREGGSDGQEPPRFAPGLSGTAAPSTVQETLRRARRGERWQVLGWAALAVVGFFAPYVIGLYELQLAIQASTMGILALSIGWMLRQTGQLSFGHAAFYGIAGYAVAYGATNWELSPPVLLLAALGLGTLTALVVALLTVRIPGIAFAMATLAIGMLVWVAGGRFRDITRGVDGFSFVLDGNLLGKPAAAYINPVDAWPLVWGALMVAVGALWLVSRSGYGRRLSAIRENEERARFSGYRTYLPRVVAFTISALVASLAGVVNVVGSGFISLESLYWTTSGLALIVAIIGGTRSVLGPPAGAAAFVLLQNYLTDVGNHYQLVLGVVLMLVVVVIPGGGAELVVRMRDAAVGRGRSALRGDSRVTSSGASSNAPSSQEA